jgi:hypothetical protein
VWACIENRANGHTRTPVMTLAQIAEELGFDKNTVTRAIAWLEANGVLTMERRNRSASRFLLHRTYGNGHATPSDDFAPQNGEPTQEPFAPHNAEPTDFAPHDAEPNPNFAPHDAEPCTKTPLEERESSTLSVNSADLDLFGTPPATPAPPQPARVAKAKAKAKPKLAAPEGWDAFWASYPRRVAKAPALAAYARKLRDGADPALILAGLRRFSFSEEERYIPHPATWLNAERWTDAAVQAAPPAPVPRPAPVDPDALRAARARASESWLPRILARQEAERAAEEAMR